MMKKKFIDKSESKKSSLKDFNANIFLQKDILGGNRCIGRDRKSSVVMDSFVHTALQP
jgi:hypothetical protein